MERNLGNTVRSLRLQADCNQDELARDAGMSASNLSKIENGQYRHPSRARVIRLAEALGRKLGWSKSELESRTNDFLRMAGWATEEEVRVLPLDAALTNIVSLGAVGAVEMVLREQFRWPPDRVEAVRRAVEIFHPNPPQPGKAA